MSGAQLVEQGLSFLQIARVEPLSEPAVNRSKQFASLLRFPLVTPETRHAHRCAEFPGLRFLLTCDGERAVEIGLRFRDILFRRHKRENYPGNALTALVTTAVIVARHGCCDFCNNW